MGKYPKPCPICTVLVSSKENQDEHDRIHNIQPIVQELADAERKRQASQGL